MDKSRFLYIALALLLLVPFAAANFVGIEKSVVVRTRVNQTCYTSVATIPAICEGGTITENTDLNTPDNCRHITCVNGDSSLSVIVCEKPDEINPDYFEMYKQNQTGTQQLKICLDGACISDNGFARSPDFPICEDHHPTPQACGLENLPATCTGGTIVQDTDLNTFDNCRHITCRNGDHEMQVTACEKPDEINPTYFEMYKQVDTGSGMQICIGSTCIDDNGFATGDLQCQSSQVKHMNSGRHLGQMRIPWQASIKMK